MLGKPEAFYHVGFLSGRGSIFYPIGCNAAWKQVSLQDQEVKHLWKGRIGSWASPERRLSPTNYLTPKVSPDPMSQLRNRQRSLVTARRIWGEAIGHVPGGAKTRSFLQQSSDRTDSLNHTESVFFVLLMLSPAKALLMHRSRRQHFSVHHFRSLTCGS